MLGVGWEGLTGRSLLECMPLHAARRAANVGGRSGVVKEAKCVILILLAGPCRLHSIQRIFSHSWCGYMHEQATVHVKHCVGFGSCSVVHFAAHGGKRNEGNIL